MALAVHPLPEHVAQNTHAAGAWCCLGHGVEHVDEFSRHVAADFDEVCFHAPRQPPPIAPAVQRVAAAADPLSSVPLPHQLDCLQFPAGDPLEVDCALGRKAGELALAYVLRGDPEGAGQLGLGQEMADRLGEAWMNDCRIHSTIIKRGLVSVNPPLINAPLKRGTVSAMTTAKQQTMAERIRLVMGADNAYDVVRKLERAGTAVSEQTIYNWLDGSEIKESNLAAFAQLYGTTPAWLRYGIGERESLSEKGAEGGRLVQQLPDELLQETLDFLGYKLQRPDVQVAEETRASYFKFSEKVRQDMARRKGGR